VDGFLIERVVGIESVLSGKKPSGKTVPTMVELDPTGAQEGLSAVGALVLLSREYRFFLFSA